MKFFLSLAILFGINLLPVTSKATDNVLVWEIIPGVLPQVTTNTFYKLFCKTNRSYLDYYSRNRGINLAFNQNLNYRNIKFVRSGNSTGPIKYGEKIAIHVNRGGYLYYCRRTYGINLCYSSTPVFQWEIRDNSYLTSPGNPNRNPVPGSATVALFNTYNGSYMIYGDRTWGPNLKWATTTPSTPVTGQINGFVRTGPYPISSTSGRCTSPITWSFTPVQLTGTSGSALHFVITKNYEALETNTGPAEWWCIFSDIFGGLKAGTWKIKVQTPLWFTECQVVIGNGNNRFNFTANKQGCGSGITFP